jgi:RecA-family ATPase
MVNGLFHKVGTGSINGKYYTGKTLVAMSLSASVLTGVAFAGCAVHRQGGVLWLAAEGERDVDKNIRAAVVALGGDPDNVPFYTQIGGVPKILGDPKRLGELIRQASRACKAEFGCELALIVIDTTIKAAGYKKSENDAVEVNAVIVAMEDFAHGYKCFVLFIDHMGKNEELGARGSSDKPSSVDTYSEIKNGQEG